MKHNTTALKKIISLLLVICMMASFAGCSPGEADSTVLSPTEATVAPTEAATQPFSETAEATTPTEEETAPPVVEPATEPTDIPEIIFNDVDEIVYAISSVNIRSGPGTDYTRFGTSCANGRYDNGYETTSHAASRLDAIFAVNGCYSAPYLNYTVVRSGELCNGSGKNLWCPAVYSSRNGLLQSAWESGGTPGIAGVNVDALVESGLVTDTFCFGPPILVGGSVAAGSDTSRAQRTFLGTNGSPGDIWVVVSEGRNADGESAGLTYSQCARLLAEKGCTLGIPLDGGGSSTMVFQGKVLNSAKAGQRSVVDFVYFK